MDSCKKKKQCTCEFLYYNSNLILTQKFRHCKQKWFYLRNRVLIFVLAVCGVTVTE